MTGIIVTGHGCFSSGMLSAVELIAGKQDYFEAVDFSGNVSDYSQSANESLLKFKCCDALIVFCDLKSGSPFQHWARLCMSDTRIKVIYGTNLATILEILLSRDYDTADLIISSALETLSDQSGLYTVCACTKDDE